MSFILRFILEPKDGLGHYTKIPSGPWYFVRAGDMWPRDPSKRLIDATTQHREDARVFASEEDARAQLCICGQPPGWNCEPL